MTFITRISIIMMIQCTASIICMGSRVIIIGDVMQVCNASKIIPRAYYCTRAMQAITNTSSRSRRAPPLN